MKKPILTVFLLTYNHAKTVEETFDSILKQKTKYPFIVKILEDCSTDNTLEICKKYVQKYPELFQLIAQPVNTQGLHIRWAMNEEIQTPYFTFIEGDDYWINENHLEKALSFFEKHHDYNMYASNMYYQWNSFQKDAFEYQKLMPEKVGHEISFDNYIYLQTSGRVYRHVFDFNQFPPQTIEGDIFLYYLYLDKGKSYCDHEIDSVYRISETGTWNKLSPTEQINAFYEVVYTAAKLLNYRHARFLLRQLPECKIKRFEKHIGSYLTLRLYVLWYNRKQKEHIIKDGSNYIKITGPIDKKKIKIKLNGENNYCSINTDKILPNAKVNISVYGDNNTIIIGKNFYLSSRLNILIGQNHPNFGKANNSIFRIDENSAVESMSYLTFNSNSFCCIGKDCMISFNVTLYNTDAHPILDLKTKRIANFVKGITIGDHVWLGQNITVLKNTQIASDCICGIESVVCGQFTQPHCIIAGNPARIVKENRTWDSDGSKGYVQNEKEQIMKPKLSVICLSYNHEKFIRQALDGFVMQKTNFPFEVIVHDDASTDKSPDIIREYAEKYPDIIKPIFQTENQFSKGAGILETFVYPKIQGLYVALCEGDDYWTDEHKLQKQVDLLDAHPDVSLCFHPVRVIWDDGSEPESIFPTPKQRFYKDILTIEDLLKHNFIQTNSVVYRWRLGKEKDLVPQGILPGDYFLHLLHAQVGKIVFLPDVMAVYRRNAGGLWTGVGVSDDWFKKCAFSHLAFYRAVEKQFNCDKSLEMMDMMAKTLKSFSRCGEWEKIQELSKIYPEIYQNVLTGHFETFSSNKRRKKHKKRILFVLVGSLVLTLLYLFLK